MNHFPMPTRAAFAVLALALLATSGCGIPNRLNDVQKSEYSALARADVVVKKKSPGTAIGLGFAPFALGSIYSGNWWVTGTADFLFWPVSILWAPANSWARVRETNYRASVEVLGPEKIRRIADLNLQRENGALTDAQYVEQARAIAGPLPGNP